MRTPYLTHPRLSRLTGLALAFVALLGNPSIGYPQSAGWSPSRNIEFITSAGAGGSQDKTVRLIEKVWRDQRVMDVPIVIMNKPGGGGVLAWAYLTQHPRDAHYLSMVTVTLLTTNIIGQTQLNHTDFTPIATLFSEYVAFAVNANSPISTGKDLIERLRKDPASVSFGLSSALGNINHIAVGKIVKALGGDVRKLKIVIFKANSEPVTAVLGGHVDVALAPASIVQPFMKSGVRVLGVAAPQRLPHAYSQVPTWREQGMDVVAANWRGMMGPPGLAPAQVAYWENAFSKLAQSSEWKETLDKEVLIGNFMGSQESRAFMTAQHRELKSILVDLGVVK